ncbi:SRPBCC family protein [uncultured Jatrophihabitans sp.]|uniref:SRPBCC family protein n=1 Tax=uncultured Jatrophihabitans sp. TaxID=1610747 RepID=UPI0035C9FCF2
MRSTATRTVSVPVETVWSVLADHEGMRNWAPGVGARVTKAGSDERNGLGAVREISAPLPVPAIVEEITEFAPPHRLAYRALAGIPLRNYRGDVELSASGEGTVVRYSISADSRLPLVGKAVTRAIAVALLAALVRQARKAA